MVYTKSGKYMQEIQIVENEFLRPAFKENNVAIFFNCDEKYVPYLAVTISSIIKNSSDRFNYDLIILYKNINDDYI